MLVGGTLLLTPGFLTDLVGFCFVLPITRPLARRALSRVIERRLLGGFAPWRGPVVPGSVIDPPPAPGPRDDDTGRPR